MRVLKLDNFTLYEYKDCGEFDDIIRKIELSDSSHYLGNIKYAIKRINQRKMENPNNFAFMAYYDDCPMGYISITYVDSQYQVSVGVLPEFRKQNLGSLLLEEFSERILDYKNVHDLIEKCEGKVKPDMYDKGLSSVDIEELVLKIDPSNIASHKMAQSVGYEQVDSTTYKRKSA